MTKQKILFLVFLLSFIAIGVKLLYLQILHPSRLSNSNYLRTKKIFPERGKIYDRTGLPLAVNKTVYTAFIEPKKIKDTEEVIEKLDSVLQLGEATLEAKIDETKDWVAIKSGIDEEKKTALSKMRIEGLGFEDAFHRYYPESSLAAHLLGFVGKNNEGESVGYFGIEGFFQKDLAGLLGVLKSERDLLGRPILIGTQEKFDPENGRDLYLTIDKSIQQIVKKKLQAGLESYQAKEGCVIVANPNNLEILALACLPDFDVDRYYEFSEDYFKNPAVSNLYEPGSTFKPFIMAAALEEKKVKPSGFYNETGPVDIGGYTIKTWNNKYEDKISLTRILEKSSNVGMVYIGEKLGKDKLYEYLQKYGFGKLTEIELQGETAGTLRPKFQWYPIDYATVTFGQGIAISPVQMIRAFSALINGGTLYKPLVISKIASEKNVNEIPPTQQGQIISVRTSHIIKKMLVSTVENGEVKWAKPKGYEIGGKTGTAQIPIEGHYDPSKTIASFVGFAPVNEPKFIALVILRETKTSNDFIGICKYCRKIL
ncbi:penicillin-binding protein 2 [Candidatus Roizmanbacteria bacterium]|nr:penicillin-binding protein 2 [Candidatus Roizmanbacteria bacterium]